MIPSEGLSEQISQSNLVISKIGPESAALLRNLFEYYLHDMSEWLRFDTTADGSYSYDTTSLWTKGCDVRLVNLGGAIAGFALVGSAAKWLGSDVQGHEIVEFFILRRFRRSGLGQQISERLWNEYPGEWLVRVLEANKPAVPFWRKAIADYSHGNYHEERNVVSGRPWLFFRFQSC